MILFGQLNLLNRNDHEDLSVLSLCRPSVCCNCNPGNMLYSRTKNRDRSIHHYAHPCRIIRVWSETIFSRTYLTQGTFYPPYIKEGIALYRLPIVINYMKLKIIFKYQCLAQISEKKMKYMQTQMI